MAAPSAGGDQREGVPLTSLDDPLFEGANATKRDLVDYLEGVADRLLPVLYDRALSVIRVHRGQEAFMQKNLPSYAPEWIDRVTSWAESSKRQVTYALCNDRRTLVWFANQRAVEYHPALTTVAAPDSVTHLVIDLDPPSAEDFPIAVQVAHLVGQALADVGLGGAVKTSGAKGMHIFVPIAGGAPAHEAAAATRALAAHAERLDPSLATTAFMKEERGGRVFVDATRAGSATVVATYSPRLRPGTPVSFPVDWDDLDHVKPGDFTIHTALKLLGEGDPWASTMPAAQQLPPGLVEEGMKIPGGRVQAMHEGRRRARANRG